jgi:dTDP-4-dehydrorhamnose reductase
MKVLITGARGQLGRELTAVASASGEPVMAVDVDTLDITSRESVHDALVESRPDVVINCAAMTAVDACEERADEAMSVNGHAVRWVAEACDAIGARLVQISTDYVFDGTKADPYVESDEPNPRSVYGHTKLVGERAALDLGDAGLVVRTSWVCGLHGSNMVKTVLKLLEESRPMAFVDDQIGHPTFAADLASMVFKLAVDSRSGIFHVTNEGAVSWFEFVREIVERSGHDPAVVKAIRTSDLQPPRPARRPANSVLENAALARAGYSPMRDFRLPLDELLDALARGRDKLTG